jgi:sugar phosphate isomerase/epimerase
MAGMAASAGALYFKKLKSVGLQLYTVRGPLRSDFEGTLAKVAEFGYAEVEFAGYYNRTPEQIRKLLDANKLKSPASHIALAELQKDPVKAIETAKTIGHHYIVCPWLEPKDRKSIDDYRNHARFFNEFGAQCQKAGLQLGYHNHDFEFTRFGDVMPYDVLLKETDPKLVKMELDLYWITRGGQDPLAYLANHPGRFEMVHVKDMAAADKSAVEVGKGTLDFKTLLARAEKAGVRHFFVEQDEPKTPLESIKVSIDYLRQLDY